MRLYYRLGVAAEKPPLVTRTDLYDGLVVNAHVGAWGQGWVSILLQQLGKPFIVDPYTYVFSHATDSTLRPDGDLRKSFEELRPSLPPILRRSLDEKRRIIPSDLRDTDGGYTTALPDVVETVLRLERELLKGPTLDQTSLEGYLALLEGPKRRSKVSPEYLIPPYFYIDNLDDPWLDVTLRCADIATRTASQAEKVMVKLAMSVDCLRDRDLAPMLTDRLHDADAIALWISGFDETEVATGTIDTMASLIEALADAGLDVHNHHGGYLSILMSRNGLSAVCSGPGYGESREVTQVTSGGGYRKRWYYPTLHQPIDEPTFRQFFSDHPEELACDCDSCRGAHETAAALSSEGTPEFVENFIEAMTRDDLTAHHMQCRKREVLEVTNRTVPELVGQLDEMHSLAEKLHFERYEIPYAFLDRWARFLEGYQ